MSTVNRPLPLYDSNINLKELNADTKLAVVVLDPKGREYAHLSEQLETLGYDVKHGSFDNIERAAATLNVLGAQKPILFVPDHIGLRLGDVTGSQAITARSMLEKASASQLPVVVFDKTGVDPVMKFDEDLTIVNPQAQHLDNIDNQNALKGAIDAAYQAVAAPGKLSAPTIAPSLRKSVGIEG